MVVWKAKANLVNLKWLFAEILCNHDHPILLFKYLQKFDYHMCIRSYLDGSVACNVTVKLVCQY